MKPAPPVTRYTDELAIEVIGLCWPLPAIVNVSAPRRTRMADRLDCPTRGRYCVGTCLRLSGGAAALGTRPARQLETRKEDLMGRTATLGTARLAGLHADHARGCPRPDQGRHPRLRAAERRPELGSPQLGAPREHHPRLPRLRSPGRARPQDRQGGPEPRGVVEERGRHDLGGQAPEGREVPRRHAVHAPRTSRPPSTAC